MPISQTLILFGYGPRVSVGVASKFVAEGWNVAVVSRRAHPELDGVERLTHIVGVSISVLSLGMAGGEPSRRLTAD